MENKIAMQKQSLFGMFFNSTIVIALITALIYIVGDMYYVGYLSGFGIDDSMFPLDVPHTLIQGLYASFYVFLTEKTVYAIAAGFVSTVSVFLCAYLMRLERVRRFLQMIRGNFFAMRLNRLIDEKYSKALGWSYFLMLFSYAVLIFYIVVVFSSYELGLKSHKIQAKYWDNSFVNSINYSRGDMRKGEDKHYMDFTVKDMDAWSHESGFVVAGNNTYLAVYTKNGLAVYPAGSITMKHAFFKK